MVPEAVNHPYFPRDLKLPHYVENDKPLEEILGFFFGFLLVISLGLWWLMGRRPHLKDRLGTKLKISWFLCCGLIHMILEGYFSVRNKTLAGEQTFLAQMWKEYSKGDSRYMSSDTFMVCMEGFTAFVDGPLAILSAYAFFFNTSHRFVTQLIVSIMQLYGATLYFLTEIKDDFQHGEMYHPLYFWFYFFFLNFLWIIIPFCCIVDSFVTLTSAQEEVDRTKKSGTNEMTRKKMK